METQFTSGEFVKQGIRVEAGIVGDLPHPFESAFELSEARFSVSNLILPSCAGLSTGWPGEPFLFDCGKLSGLVMDGALKAGLKIVDLLSFGLGVERQLGVML